MLNGLLRLKYTRLSAQEKAILRGNAKWKNKYRGRRCFIVGNGPSLANQDLSFLADEYVFTVNQIMRSPLYAQLRSDFHVIADGLYFDLDPENEHHREVIGLIRNINTAENRPACFFPLGAKGFLERIGLDAELDISYFFSVTKTFDDFENAMDMTRCMPGYNTVAQYAVSIAIYMGFSEIYLLGCDMTGYKEVEQFATGTFVGGTHVYALSPEEMKKALHSERTSETWFCGFAQMFTDYRRLYEYTSKKGILLANATDGGVLDSLPRVRLESLAGGEHE